MRGAPYVFADFRGGLNTRDEPYGLEPNEARDLRDVVPVGRGALRKRKGSVTLAAPSDVLTSLRPLTVASKWLVGAGGTKLFKITAAGVSADLKTGVTAGLRWALVQAPASGGQGQLFAMNGTDTPQQWDGAAASSSNWTAAAGTVPNGKFMVFHAGRLWVAGVPGAPNDLYFSNLNDPRDWPAANVVRFDPNDGDMLTGIGKVGPYLGVFKEHKSYVVVDLDTGANRPLSSAIGCAAHRSIVETDRGTFFLCGEGVYSTDGNRVTLVSDKIRPTLEALAANQRQNAAGAFADGHYYLSVSAGGALNDLTLDLDLELGTWWEQSLAANEWAQLEPSAGVELFAARPGSALVSQAFVDGTYQDSGVSYLSRWAGPFHTFGSTRLRKRCRELHFDGSGSFDVYVARDFPVASSFEGTVDLASDSSTFGGADTYGGGGSFGGTATVQEDRIWTLGVGRAWSVEFRQQAAEAFEIDSYTLMMTARKD